MFRKIVSNISFTSSAKSQLAFYGKRLRKEEFTRRLGLVFVVLALVLQSLSVFSPPDAANAANSNDLVYGGIRPADGGIAIFLRSYDSNVNGLRDIMNYFGITRAEIAATKHGAWTDASVIKRLKSVNHRQQGSTGEQAVVTTNSNNNTPMTFYTRPLYRSDNQVTTIWGFKGYSSTLQAKTGAGTFYLMDICGNLLIETVPQPPVPPKPAVLELNKTATNASQGGINATTATAKAKDEITYTITAKNTGGTATTTELKDDLTDVLEYATLTDNGGGVYNDSKKELSWSGIAIAPNQSVSKTFKVRLLDTIPTTSQGVSDPTSFDCRIHNVFGNQTVIPVECTTPKVIEEVVTELPQTGPAENLAFATIVLAITTYFYARSRQLGKEVRLVRKEVAA